jgi:hypothetical protein
VLATRFIQLVVLPIAAFLFLQVWNSVNDLRDTLSRIETRITVQERLQLEQQRRIDRLEALYYRNLPRSPLPGE